MKTLTDDAAILEWADLLKVQDDLVGVKSIPVNVAVLDCWAVQHPLSLGVPAALPQPTYRLPLEGWCQSAWCLRTPVRFDQTKPVNAWKMTMAMLTAALHGRELTEIANPLPWADLAEWTGALTDITTMKSTLGRAGYWKNRFYTEARQAGGNSMTDAQTEARRANFVAARKEAQRQHAERADARARDLVAMAATGATDADIAEHYGIAVGSVATTLARARLRVPETVVAPAPVEEVERVDLEELAEMLSTDDSNVLLLRRRLAG